MPFGADPGEMDQNALLTLAAIGMVLVTVLRATAGYVNTVSFALAATAC